MPNAITLAQQFVSILDEIYKLASTSPAGSVEWIWPRRRPRAWSS